MIDTWTFDIYAHTVVLYTSYLVSDPFLARADASAPGSWLGLLGVGVGVGRFRLGLGLA